MLLTLETTHTPATDLGFLLHKHPDRFQTHDLSFGKAHVFYPVVSESFCRCCLLLDIDPIDMARGQNLDQRFVLGHYVNDRPFVASSLMSVALSRVFGSASSGNSKERPELAKTPIPLTASLDVLPVRGGEDALRRLFEPLGYTVEARRHPLDENFPDWGESPYFSVRIEQTLRLSELLSHLYVLVPVFDNQKHYFVGQDELEKLLAKGETWLADHPHREEITRRYLKSKPSLYRQALERLAPDESDDDTPEKEQALEKSATLNEQRLGAVVSALLASGAKTVLDLGCGEGKLIRSLLQERQFERIVGVDVSVRALEVASRRLKLERLPQRQADRLELQHGSLMYRDSRFEGFDAAAIVEVVEHLDPPRLSAFERVVFDFAHPQTVVLTTPNREYNVTWESLEEGRLRHADHRFEWTRPEFQVWANGVATRFGYSVRFLPVGPIHEELGPPTQMAVFSLA